MTSYISVLQAAIDSGLSPATIRRMAKEQRDGFPKAVRVGDKKRNIRLSLVDYVAWKKKVQRAKTKLQSKPRNNKAARSTRRNT